MKPKNQEIRRSREKSQDITKKTRSKTSFFSKLLKVAEHMDRQWAIGPFALPMQFFNISLTLCLFLIARVSTKSLF